MNRKTIVQLIIDFSLAIIMTIIFVLMASKITPTRRGFYCSDETIRYPYLGFDTVTTTMLLSFVFLFSLFTIITVEVTLFILTKRKQSTSEFQITNKWSCLRIILKLYGIFWFGLNVTGLITEVVKLSSGRLRPHFIDVCQPDFRAINCSIGYIEQYTCVNPRSNLRQLTEARKSFPSGHASLAVYTAVFIAYYFRQRLGRIEHTVFLNLVLQVLVIIAALFTGVSRVIDYKHHWSDVVAGSILGLFVALWTSLSLSNLLNYTGGYFSLTKAGKSSRINTSVQGHCNGNEGLGVEEEEGQRSSQLDVLEKRLE
jgi:phosphatidate phosphatase